MQVRLASIPLFDQNSVVKKMEEFEAEVVKLCFLVEKSILLSQL
jgi:hypothetical protein